MCTGTFQLQWPTLRVPRQLLNTFDVTDPPSYLLPEEKRCGNMRSLKIMSLVTSRGLTSGNEHENAKMQKLANALLG